MFWYITTTPALVKPMLLPSHLASPLMGWIIFQAVSPSDTSPPSVAPDSPLVTNTTAFSDGCALS